MLIAESLRTSCPQIVPPLLPDSTNYKSTCKRQALLFFESRLQILTRECQSFPTLSLQIPTNVQTAFPRFPYQVASIQVRPKGGPNRKGRSWGISIPLSLPGRHLSRYPCFLVVQALTRQLGHGSSVLWTVQALLP